MSGVPCDECGTLISPGNLAEIVDGSQTLHVCTVCYPLVELSITKRFEQGEYLTLINPLLTPWYEPSLPSRIDAWLIDPIIDRDFKVGVGYVSLNSDTWITMRFVRVHVDMIATRVIPSKILEMQRKDNK